MKRLYLFVILAIVGIASASARLTMPQLFQQGMVLQRGKAIPVWGTALPQEKITVSWNRRQYTTQADTQGRWRIDLPAMKAGGPYTMQVSDESNTVLTYGDVLVGDVWICSGQSNIDVTIERVYPQYPEEIDRLNNPKIRLFRVQNETNTHGVQNDIRPTTINWKPLNKENAWLFSAVGTFLGKRMYEKSGVPQGIIVNSWGGTPIEAWIPEDSLQKDYPLLPMQTRLYQDDKLTAAQQEAAQRVNDRWMHLLNETDPGLSEQWTAESYNDATWQEINQYNLSPALFCPRACDNKPCSRACDNKPCPRACDNIAGITNTDFIGSLWLRQHIHIDQAHAGKAARLLLGTLYDQDYTYLNGKEVGRTYYQYPPRRYNIAAGMLHEGDNILTVRFVNKQGIPHFIKEKPYMLIFGEGDTLRLSEQWKGRLGATMPACPNLGLSLQNMPSTLYNAVVYPLAPYAVSGIVWYQGETNTSNPAPYADYLKKMMGSWRSLWQDPQMPFCIVQLANYMAPSDKPQDSSWARLREQQRLTAANDNRSELAVIIDLGEANDIHPLRKKEVAERIGLCMDRLVYGKKVQLSPQCTVATLATVPDASASGSTPVTLTFNQPLQPGSIEELEVTGCDGSFVNAKGTAQGRTVTIASPINNVTRVRYAWKDNPAKANLLGTNGLPASPFEISVNNPTATGLNTATPVGESAIPSQTSPATIPDEDGHDLWLRYKPVNKARVTITAPHFSTNTAKADSSLFTLHSPLAIARQELETYYQGAAITLTLDDSMPDDDGYAFDGTILRARREAGLLYGAYALLRQQHSTPVGESAMASQTQQPAPLSSHPAVALRLLNHWDNPDGSIERGYAGESIFEWFNLDRQLITEYARANASIGINGTVLNNVNASPKMLTTPYLKEVSTIADILRPYGIKVYLSINFATPKALGDTETADPLDEGVRQWWQKKANEIYDLIPDFGGFLVKANSEGQPGPGDYHRTHADGANMLADALAPHQGIVMWRCFVYGANHKGEDRVKQAVSEFKPLDGQFRSNLILQTKNGPLDFQPREPYSPVFDQIHETPNMAELQITQEYLGQSRHLVYLAPLWKEFFTYVPASQLKGIVGVANIGKDRNWCGHHFSQANWYAFGRQAWDPTLSTEQIAREWLQQTFTTDEAFVAPMTTVMEESREACVNYMMPLGLHHIFKFDHHYGPEPDGFKADYPLEWCPVYYHKATKDSIGFNRSTTGTDAVSQYRPDIARIYNDIHTCPENLLLWFHRVPWTYRMQDGSTLWQAMQRHYRQGVNTVEEHYNTWHNAMRPYIDQRRWQETDQRLQEQLVNAREWRDTCLGYFGTFAH